MSSSASTATVLDAPGVPAMRSAAGDRVPLRQKLGYGFGSFVDLWGHWLYQSLAFHVFNVGLGMAPGLISTALGIKIFFDAVSDALFGWLSDNTRTRWGRRRPFILVGGVLAGVGLPLMFAVGHGWTDTQYFAFMLVSLMVYVPVMSCFNMPWVSLGTEMTPDYHERTSVMSVKNAVQKLPEVGMFVAAQFTTLAVFNDANGKPDILLGAQVYCSLLGAVMVALSVAIFLLVREPYYGAVVLKTRQRVPFRDTLYRTLQNRPFRVLLGTMMVYGTATAMVSLLGYYTTIYYVCRGDVALATKWNSAMGLSGMVFGFAGIVFFGAIARRQGKRNALLAVLGLALCAFVADWWLYDPERPALQLLACGFVAFTGAGFWTIYGSALADVVEHDELHTGQRREGSFAACQSWISKVGMAVGNGASGWILQFTGFDAKVPLQGEQVIFVIRLLLSGIPAIGLAIAMVLLLRFELDERRMRDVRTALEARRGKV